MALKRYDFLKRWHLQFSCMCVLKKLEFKTRLWGIKGKRPMQFGWLRAKTHVSSCDLRFRTAIWSYHRRQGCDLGKFVAKRLRFCVCVLVGRPLRARGVLAERQNTQSWAHTAC